MGQFSWLDCQSGKQILDGLHKNVYLLVPIKFGGGHIEEPCYSGYGIFGRNDIYDLVAKWNKFFIPKIISSPQGYWEYPLSDIDKIIMSNFYYSYPLNKGINRVHGYQLEKRYIGIIMSCYDKDNFRLPYPIKITYDKTAIYEKCNPSFVDPDQGW